MGLGHIGRTVKIVGRADSANAAGAIVGGAAAGAIVGGQAAAARIYGTGRNGFERVTAHDLDSAPTLKLGVEKTTRLSVSLPESSVTKLRGLGGRGSLSKQVRTTFETGLFFAEQARNGAEIYIRSNNGQLSRVELPNE